MRVHSYLGAAYQISDAHPAADCLPWSLESEEFASLVQSMREHGFDGERPISILKDGRIIGGRRRELAAKVAGIQPIYTEVDYNDVDIVAWVMREDLVRRNLTASQRSMAMVELAKLKQLGDNQFFQENNEEEGVLFKTPSAMSIGEIAEKAQVGREIINQAVKVKNKAPELMDAVKEGSLPAYTAAKVADLPKPARERVAQAENPKEQAKKEIEKAKEEPKEEVVDEEKAAADEWERSLSSLCRDIDAIVKRVREIKDSKFAFMCHWDSAAQQIAAARSTIYMGRPIHKCPYCESQGKTNADCRCCLGTGYCTIASRKAGLDAVGGGK